MVSATAFSPCLAAVCGPQPAAVLHGAGSAAAGSEGQGPRVSQMLNKRQALDWALLTAAMLTHVRSTHRDLYFGFV